MLKIFLFLFHKQFLINYIIDIYHNSSYSVFIILKLLYIDSFKYKGFDISFNEDDFKSHQTCFKKAFLEIIRKYNHGKYFLRFNPDTLKIEVLNH